WCRSLAPAQPTPPATFTIPLHDALPIFSLPSGLDIQKPKGGKKATIRDEGAPPAQLDIEVELLPEELQEFESHIPLLRPRSKNRSAEHTSELQSRENLVCRLLLEKKKQE